VATNFVALAAAMLTAQVGWWVDPLGAALLLLCCVCRLCVLCVCRLCVLCVCRPFPCWEGPGIKRYSLSLYLLRPRWGGGWTPWARPCCCCTLLVMWARTLHENGATLAGLSARPELVGRALRAALGSHRGCLGVPWLRSWLVGDRYIIEVREREGGRGGGP